jgi:hypothetical protein
VDNDTVPVGIKPEADPAEVAKAITSETETAPAPRMLTPQENAELSRQIKRVSRGTEPENPLDLPGPPHIEVTVVGPAKGFRRAGHRFSRVPTVFDADTMTVGQLVALQDEPELVVSFAEKPAAPAAG